MSVVDWQMAPAANEFAPERQAVGEVAVVGDREAAGLEFGEQGLDVAQRRLAGRRVAHMADGRLARQAIDRRGAGKMIADQALATFRMKPHPVEGDDARRLLSAMLQGVQAERHDRRGVGMAEDAEDAAFLMQPVFLEIDARGVSRFESAVDGVLARFAGGLGPPVYHCLGIAAGAAGAGWGTFLLIRASSFCLS